jgi:hypothetical protein
VPAPPTKPVPVSSRHTRLLRAAVPALVLGAAAAERVTAQAAEASGSATVRVAVRIMPALDAGALRSGIASAGISVPAPPDHDPAGVLEVVTAMRCGDAPHSRRESVEMSPPLVRWLEIGADGDRLTVRRFVAVAY